MALGSQSRHQEFGSRTTDVVEIGQESRSGARRSASTVIGMNKGRLAVRARPDSRMAGLRLRACGQLAAGAVHGREPAPGRRLREGWGRRARRPRGCSAAVSGGLRPYLELARLGTFRNLALGSFVSNLGDGMAMVAVPWLGLHVAGSNSPAPAGGRGARAARA